MNQHLICAKPLLICGLLLSLFLPATAQVTAPPATAGYDALLQKHVNAKGKVDYTGLKANRAALDAYVSAIGNTTADQYRGWAGNQRKAFLINAYNAITLRSIIDAFPVRSIRDIDGVWKKKTWPIIGTRLTLDQIEHERLRKEWRDGRIHMAVNCASVGCPDLRVRAFTAANLDAELDEQTRLFFTNPIHFRADQASRTIHLSKLFEWFKADFGNTGEFIARYTDADTGAFAKGWRTKTAYIEYDWALNGQ